MKHSIPNRVISSAAKLPGVVAPRAHNMAPPTPRDTLKDLRNAHGLVFKRLQAFIQAKSGTTKNPELLSALKFLDDAMRFQGVCLAENESCFKSPEALSKIHQQIEMASKYAKVLKELEPRKNEASILDNLSPQLADIGSPVLDSIASAKDSSDIVKAEAAPIVSAANKSIEVSPARAILSQLDEKQIEAKKAGRADVAAEIQIEKARIADSQVSKINPPASAAMQSLKHKYLALIARFTDIVAAIVGAPSVMQQINPHSKSQRQAHDALMSAEQTHQRVQQLAKSINSHLQKLKAIALTTLDQCQMQIKLSASPKSRSLAEICCNSAQLILQEIDRAIVFLNKCCAAASKQAHNSVQPSALVHPSKISATSKQAALAPSEINKKFNQSAQAISINLDSVQKNLEQAKIDDQKRQAAIDAARGRASQINRR